MKFNLKTWKSYYKSTHRMGKELNFLKTNQFCSNTNRIYYLELKISQITKNCSNYLDKCGMKMAPMRAIIKKEEYLTKEEEKHEFLG